MQIRAQKGFTLVELMIVVVILGIIVAVAFPAYLDNIQQSRRGDATATLMETAHLLERCYTETNSYEKDSSGDACVDFPVESDEGYYDIDSDSLDPSTYTLSATPASGSPQADDDECAKFILEHTGERIAENTNGEDSEHCW